MAKIKHIALTTHDLEKVASFYKDVFGMAEVGRGGSTHIYLSDGDLKHLLAFLDSPPGKRYVSAYIASLGAGFDAMGRRCGEQLGESLRELAQAQLDVPTVGPPSIAAPARPH